MCLPPCWVGIVRGARDGLCNLIIILTSSKKNLDEVARSQTLHGLLNGKFARRFVVHKRYDCDKRRRVSLVWWYALFVRSSHEQARSQSGLVAGAPVTCVPTSPLLQFDPQLFRILLLRRLRLPLPSSLVSCVPGGRQRCAVESVAACVCTEVRVTTNIMCGTWSGT